MTHRPGLAQGKGRQAMPPEGLCHTSGRGQACLLGAPSLCVERVGTQLFCFSLSCTGENSVPLTFRKERRRVCMFRDESQNDSQDITDAICGCVAGCQSAHITPRVQGLGFLLDLV